VAVFRECLQALFMVKEQFPTAVSEASKTILPEWTTALQHILSQDARQDVQDESTWQNLALRTECFKALDVILSTFPKSLSASLDALLRVSTDHLSALESSYRHLYLLESDDLEPTFKDEGADISCSLSILLGHLFDFLQHAARKPWIKFSFIDKQSGQASELLSKCIASILSYAAITVDQVGMRAEQSKPD
jgi:hypothetical protein